jgi:hypothetical protein
MPRLPASSLLRQGFGEQAAGASVAGSKPSSSVRFFILAIGDPTRFRRKRDVAANLGLVPRRDQSVETDKLMRISKAGDAYPRRLPAGAAQSIPGPFGPDTALKREGLGLAERGGPRAKRKAVAAVARNLAVWLLALWHDEALSETDGPAARAFPTEEHGIEPNREPGSAWLPGPHHPARRFLLRQGDEGPASRAASDLTRASAPRWSLIQTA